MPPKGSKIKKKSTKKANTDSKEDTIHVQEPVDIKVAEPTASDMIPEFKSAEPKDKYKFKAPLFTDYVILHTANESSRKVMTIYEYAEVISQRAAQIQKSFKSVFTSIGTLSDPRDIAKKEILDKKCPLSIIRKLYHDPITNRTICEKLSVNDLAIPYDVQIT